MKKMFYIFTVLLLCSFNQVFAQHVVAIRIGAQCANLGTTVFSNYTAINEGATYTIGSWTLPANYASVQPLYDALKGSTFLLESGALSEDIRIDWILANMSCNNGTYLPVGNLSTTVFNGYFIVYHQVNGAWTPVEPYVFANGKKAVLSLKNSPAFQTLLAQIPGGAVNAAFCYYMANTNSFDLSGLTFTPPSPMADTTQFWVLTAAHFSNIVGGDKYGITGVNDNNHPVPSSFDLAQNYPNPFNPSTSIEYSVPERTFVEVNVYNVLGIKVASLVKGTKEAGTYKVQFDGSKLSSGLYIYEIKTNKFSATRKMMLLK